MTIFGMGELRAQESCAQASIIEGTKCPDIKVQFDLTKCEDSAAGTPEAVCKNGNVEASLSGRKAKYSAKFEEVEVWGKKSYNLLSVTVGALKDSKEKAKSKPEAGVSESSSAKSAPAVSESNLSKPAAKKNKATKMAPDVNAKQVGEPKVEAPQKVEVSSSKPLEFSGFVDINYVYNFLKPEAVTTPSSNLPGGQNAQRAYDTYHNQFSVSLAELSLKKSSDQVSFLMDVDFGEQTEWNHGTVSGASTVYDEVSKHLGQAVLTYSPSWWKGASISLGKMYTHIGYEVAKSRDNWQYSRSWSYWLAIPVWHAGLALNFPVVEDRLAMGLYVYNGWNNLYDNNQGKTLGFQAKLTPNSQWTLIYNFIGGPEQSGTNSDWKIVNEANASVAINDRLSFALEALMGTEQYDTQNNSYWFGSSLHAKYIANSKFWISPRLEYFRDSEGSQTASGSEENLWGGTLTLGCNALEKLEFRLETRWDYSRNSELFTGDKGEVGRNQVTTGLAALYSF